MCDLSFSFPGWKHTEQKGKYKSVKFWLVADNILSNEESTVAILWFLKWSQERQDA